VARPEAILKLPMPLSKNGSIYQLASIIVDEGGEEVALLPLINNDRGQFVHFTWNFRLPESLSKDARSSPLLQ